MSTFNNVDRRLQIWAAQVKNSRASAIVDFTKEAIVDIATFLNLPEDLNAYLNEYEAWEGTLHSVPDYRDHFVHPFHVFVLGYLIIAKWKAHKNENEDWELPLGIDFEALDQILKSWFLASIYHDVGCPAAKLETLTKNFFSATAGREPISQFDWSPVILAGDNIIYLDLLSECFSEKDSSNQDRYYEFEKWLHRRLLVDHDHGILSALMLLKLIPEPVKHSELKHLLTSKEYNFLIDAALAIALHTYRLEDAEKDHPIGTLWNEHFSLAFLLSFCDEAQNWGRNVLLSLTSKGIVSNIKDSIICNIEEPVPEFRQDLTRINIKYEIDEHIQDEKAKGVLAKIVEIANLFYNTWSQNEAGHKFSICCLDRNDSPICNITPRIKD